MDAVVVTVVLELKVVGVAGAVLAAAVVLAVGVMAVAMVAKEAVAAVAVMWQSVYMTTSVMCIEQGQ